VLGARRSALGPVLEAGAAVLARSGVDDPRRDVAELWAALTGTTPGRVWLARSETVPDELFLRFDDALERRAAGEPLEYVTGVAAFRTVELAVTRSTLIPRPETEGLVEHVLRWAAERRAPSAEQRVARGIPTALDVGTGSGCIALSLAVEVRFDRIVATDMSEAALAVARANHAVLAPAVSVDFRQGSLFAPLAPGERFDVIVANPPYLTEGEYVELDASVREWEPREALVSGADGLAHVRALLAGAAAHLVPGGLLAIELDCRRADHVVALARAGGWPDARIEIDLFGRPRYLLATHTRAEP
jgi:release factor glutamine methyltransferase